VQGFGKAKSSGPDGRQKVILAAGALLIACMVAMLVLFIKQSSNNSQSAQPAVSPSVGTVTLFIAERPVYIGQKLEDAQLREAMWPRSQIPEGAVRDRAELAGMYAKTDLPAGIPVQRTHLTDTPTAAVLPVTPGNRAVTIDVDATSGLEGLALPGTRVDVVLTYSQEGELTSKVVVQNARVLSLGGNTEPFNQPSAIDGRRAAARPAKTVTLDVTPKDALTIRTGSQLGRLSLVMRSTDDTNASATTEVTANDVGGVVSSKPAKPQSITPGCTKGFYKINGQEFQLNCDGSRFEMNNVEEP